MSAAATQQQPITATLDGVPRGTVSNDTGVRSGEQFSEVDPRDNAKRGTDQCWRTSAKSAPNVIRIHTSPHDELAWTAAAFQTM